jgi:hypothetical protein
MTHQQTFTRPCHVGLSVCFAAATLVAATLPAQAEAQDRDGAVTAVETMFEGMRSANSDMVRGVLARDARFAVIDGTNGSAIVSVQSVDGWVDAIGQSGGDWNEQIYDLDVRVDGDMASIWAPYTFYFQGSVRHCGINSIELLRGADGWKITQVSDTRRTEDCPDPLGP